MFSLVITVWIPLSSLLIVNIYISPGNLKFCIELTWNKLCFRIELLGIDILTLLLSWQAILTHMGQGQQRTHSYVGS